MAPRPPIDELIDFIRASLAGSRIGTTTANGDGGGLSLIDSGLAGAGATSFVSMCAVIAPDSILTIDSSDIVAFNNATGEVTFNKAYKGGQVLAGTQYAIITYRFVPAEVAAVMAALTTIGLQYIEGAVSDAGPAAADFDTDLAEATDTHYDGMLLMFTDGDCAGQAHVIDAYLGANGNCAFSAEDRWTEAPGDGDNFVILPAVGVMMKAIYARQAVIAGYIDTEIGAIKDVVDLAALASVLGALDTAAATGAVSNAKMAMAYLKQLVTQGVSCLPFYSATEAIIVIPAAGADLDFPSVVIAGLPTGCNILRVEMILFIGSLFDTSSAENQIKVGTTDQLFVKLSSDAWNGGAGVVDKCLDFPALGLQVDADAYRGGTVLMGATDIKAVVDGNGTYNFRSEETNKTKGVEATGGTLELLDVSIMIRVWFS